MLQKLLRRTKVDRYWGKHLVMSEDLKTAQESLDYLEWRFEEYPLFREFSGLWGEHDGEVILDYGCGPGNDVTGFLVHTDAAKVIGVDVSSAALAAARKRIALHDIPQERYELIEISDAKPGIPLDDDSIDYLSSQGVIHHTSDPLSILRELHRVLKPGHKANVMAYHEDSVWLHLYTAYVVQIVEGRYSDMPLDEAFKRTTDGPECPVSNYYSGEDFAALCGEAGFEAEFLGGYPSRHELNMIEEHLEAALSDERLGAEHREFLREVELDDDGYPRWRGKHAGIGGAYVLTA